MNSSVYCMHAEGLPLEVERLCNFVDSGIMPQPFFPTHATKQLVTFMNLGSVVMVLQIGHPGTTTD